MKVLKGLAVGFLSFILFLSLTIFGLAFTVNSTALNPDFVTNQIDRLDVAALVRDGGGTGLPRDIEPVVITAITNAEPLVKQQVAIATRDIYAYLRGETPTLNLKAILRKDLLNGDFAASLLERTDVAPVVTQLVKQQFAGQIPASYMKYVDAALPPTIAQLKPWINAQVKAADPVFDYLVGNSESFNVVIQLEPVKQALMPNLRQAFLASPPPEFAALPPAQLGQLFDVVYPQLTRQIPSTFILNEATLNKFIGPQARADFSRQIAQVEAKLVEARQVVSQFQLGYNLLIALIVLLVLGIVLIYHEVKASTRSLGITFLTYGAFEYAGTFATKYLADNMLSSEVPPVLQTWVSQFISDFISPLQVFSLVCLIGGVVLLVVSFVYRKRQEQPKSS